MTTKLIYTFSKVKLRLLLDLVLNALKLDLRSREYFDRRYVKKTALYTFKVEDVVLLNIKKRLSNIKNVVKF